MLAVVEASDQACSSLHSCAACNGYGQNPKARRSQGDEGRLCQTSCSGRHHRTMMRAMKIEEGGRGLGRYSRAPSISSRPRNVCPMKTPAHVPRPFSECLGVHTSPCSVELFSLLMSVSRPMFRGHVQPAHDHVLVMQHDLSFRAVSQLMFRVHV